MKEYPCTLIKGLHSTKCFSQVLLLLGAPVAQWVKHWPTDLVVPGSSPALTGNLSNHKQGSIAHNPSLIHPYCNFMFMSTCIQCAD